jgi:hypothetical protein
MPQLEPQPGAFLNSRRYGSDQCARECKDAQNDEIHGYAMYQHWPEACTAPHGRQPEFQYDHVNLRARVGYGNTDACIVDAYSQLRQAPTRGKCHIQLFERIFQGCPNLRPGTANPEIESPLVQGSSGYSPCAKATFADFELKVTPLVPCMRDIQDPEHVVERGWVRGGDDTRSFVRRQEFLSACAPQHLRRQR